MVSSRTKAITKNKTNAYDPGMMLINAGVISGFGDFSGLQKFLDRADQLEMSFVSASGIWCIPCAGEEGPRRE